jgi:PKD repeat protein
MNRTTDNYRIDSKVFTMMLVLSTIFLALVAFRYKNTQPCPPADFTFRTANKFDVAYINEKIYLSSETKYNAKEWEWDFGDKTPVDNTSGPYVTHTYTQPGVYTIRLTVNGKCQQVKEISIGKREERKKLYLRPVWPPDQLQAGREYFFGDSTFGATSWSWYFGNDMRRDKQSVSYQFVEPGTYKVILVINGEMEHARAERTFTVVAPPKPNSPPIAPGTRNRPSQGGGGNTNSNPDIAFNPPEGGSDKNPPIQDYFKEAYPSLGEGALKAYILDINGNGANALLKHLKGGSFSSCSILFNGKSISIDQLKDNMVEHAKNGKSLNAKQEVDAKENYIKVIEVTAELKRRKVLFGSRERSYPH